MERDLRLKAEMPGKESEDSSGPGSSGGIPDSYATNGVRIINSVLRLSCHFVGQVVCLPCQFPNVNVHHNNFSRFTCILKPIVIRWYFFFFTEKTALSLFFSTPHKAVDESIEKCSYLLHNMIMSSTLWPVIGIETIAPICTQLKVRWDLFYDSPSWAPRADDDDDRKSGEIRSGSNPTNPYGVAKEIMYIPPPTVSRLSSYAWAPVVNPNKGFARTPVSSRKSFWSFVYLALPTLFLSFLNGPESKW